MTVPFAVAIVALRHPPWHANLDLALTELRVRDTVSGAPPLVGLSGRIEAFGVAGSHPGPLGFWLLAPLYRLFGGSSWALQAATATLNLAAVTVAVWIGHRRGGRTGALAVAAGMAVLLGAYGSDRWTQAWNPYLALMWWPVVLLGVWSVLCRDQAMLPVVVAAGSLCLQTHVSYLGLVTGLLGMATAGLAVTLVRDRAAGRPVSGTVRWGAAAAVLLVALWIPPLVEQVQNEPGNLAIIREQFAHPTRPPAGWRTGVETTLHSLDPQVLLVAGAGERTSAVPGAFLLAVWAAAAAATWRRGRHVGALVRLHVVVACALVLGAASISRIQGTVLDYLVLWSWATTALACAAIAWTAVELLGAGDRPGPAPSRAGDAGLAVGRSDLASQGRRARAALALTGALVVALATTTWDAAHAQAPQPGQARLHAVLLPDAVAALRGGTVPGGGADGRYLVRSDDPLSAGLNTFTVLLELERHGLDAGVDATHAVSARPFRVLPESDATAVVTYVVGPRIADWRRRADAVEIAHAEPSPADLAEYARRRGRAVAELDADGHHDLAARLDGGVLAVGVDPRVRESTVALLQRMIELGAPTSIFVSPAAA